MGPRLQAEKSPRGVDGADHERVLDARCKGATPGRGRLALMRSGEGRRRGQEPGRLLLVHLFALFCGGGRLGRPGLAAAGAVAPEFEVLAEQEERGAVARHRPAAGPAATARLLSTPPPRRVPDIFYHVALIGAT